MRLTNNRRLLGLDSGDWSLLGATCAFVVLLALYV